MKIKLLITKFEKILDEIDAKRKIYVNNPETADTVFLSYKKLCLKGSATGNSPIALRF